MKKSKNHFTMSSMKVTVTFGTDFAVAVVVNMRWNDLNYFMGKLKISDYKNFNYVIRGEKAAQFLELLKPDKIWM